MVISTEGRRIPPQAKELPPRVIPTEGRPTARAEEPLAKISRLLDYSTSVFLDNLIERMIQADDLMYVYLMASDSGTLYLGVTNNIIRRVYEHKIGLNKCFSNKYSCHRLVYFEIHHTAGEAIAREKQIKCWRREKKGRLICTLNSKWLDLAPLLPATCDMVENARGSSARAVGRPSVGMTLSGSS